MSEKKGATCQSFIRKEVTTYRIGTLAHCTGTNLISGWNNQGNHRSSITPGSLQGFDQFFDLPHFNIFIGWIFVCHFDEFYLSISSDWICNKRNGTDTDLQIKRKNTWIGIIIMHLLFNLRLNTIKGDKSISMVFDSETFRNYFISSSAYSLIVWLMRSPQNFEKIATLKIWQLISFRGVKTHFG